MLATVDGHDEAMRLTGVFMQYYRENARWLERTYDFVPRIGLDELQALLVEDRDGIVAGLEERMQAAVDAYGDPWLEGREPATAGQFADALPLLPLPQVPVRDAPDGSLGVAAGRGGGERAARERRRTGRTTRGRWRDRAPETDAHRLGPVDGDPARRGRGPSRSATQQVAVFRLRDGTLRATQARCPHAGGPLADGQLDPTDGRLPAAPARLLVRGRHVRRGRAGEGVSRARRGRRDRRGGVTQP